jgi:8-oxoguanine deaminase
LRCLIENIHTLYTCDTSDRVLRNAWLIVEDGRVGALGAGIPPDGAFDERIDLTGCIAMPGLVNTHHHFFQTLTRAIPRVQRGLLWDWLKLLYPVWGGMQPDDLGAAAAATSAELLLTGATTSADHLYLIPRCEPAYLDAEIAAVGEAGIRLHLIRGCMTTMEGTLEKELSAKLGPKAGNIVDDPALVLADMRRVIDRFHDTSQGSMRTVALGPTTSTYSDLETLRAISTLADEAQVGLHIHIHPQDAERDLCWQRFGKSPLEVLHNVGYLTPRTWLAHATRLTFDEMDLCAEQGVGVSHCPRMILRLGARITPIHEMRRRGVRLAVGVDGAASNDSGSMLGEMRLALLLHRLAGGGNEVPSYQWLDPYDVLLMATRDAAAMIGRSDIGRLEVGMCADVAAFDLRGVGFAGATLDPLSGLLLAGDDTRAALTMVAGKPLVRNGCLLHGDEERLRARVDAATERLVSRASSLLGMDYRAFADRAPQEV